MFKINILSEEVKSDFAFEVYAKTLSELFRGAGIAMMGAMINLQNLESESINEFEIKTNNLELLLYDFLGELIYLKDVEEIIFKDFEITISEKGGEYDLTCRAHSSTINYDKHEMLTDVKAVTMHKFEIVKKGKEWYCHVIVDL